jgi:mannose PTS system EIIA component
MSELPVNSEAQAQSRKVGGVIVSHGQLATELLAAAETIVGVVSHITAVSIGWHDDVDGAQSDVERALKRVDSGLGVLILTDMFGGTPTNIAAMFLKEGVIEVVTGVNLPMIIRLASQPGEETLQEVARNVLKQGREGIYVAGDLLLPPVKK